MIRTFLLRWMINFLGLWAAASILSGVNYQGEIQVVVIAALIFSIINAFIRPLVVLLALPAIVLTLGLFTLVVNAFMLYLVTVFYDSFQVSSFWQALVAVGIVWIVNYLFTDLIEGGKRANAV
ncbi:phage holin family protein [Patescibacteria group bacterium]|nr:MAG: phage holin family protein [Patescibacteria group bacterium]